MRLPLHRTSVLRIGRTIYIGGMVKVAKAIVLINVFAAARLESDGVVFS